MEKAEREVLNLLGSVFVLFDKLPVVYRSDREEFIHAIHAAQNIILARVGLRALFQDNKKENESAPKRKLFCANCEEELDKCKCMN